MSWKRARSPEQKVEREQEILDAAASLFARSDYASITLNAIAEHAKFTRSNVYRYFKTREEIFLRLYVDAVCHWASDLESTLKELDASTSSEQVARRWVECALRHERLLALTPLLNVSLERNSSEEEIARMKGSLMQNLGGLHVAASNVMPGLELNAGLQLMTWFHSLCAGLWPAANPNEAIRNVLARPEFQWMQIDFEAYLVGALTHLIQGLRDEARSKSGV